MPLIQRTADHRLTKFTRCAPCGAVAPRVLGHSATKIADKAQAGRLFCALPRVAPGTFRLAAKRQVNSTLAEIALGIIPQNLAIHGELTIAYLGF